MAKSELTWRKISESEKEEIRNQSKKIMDSFAKALEKVSDKMEEPLIERPEGERVESDAGCLDLDRKIMFANAPKSNDDFIFAEKGGWKE